MAKCIKQCDTCGRITKEPTAQRNCSNFGVCYGRLYKFDLAEHGHWTDALESDDAEMTANDPPNNKWEEA